MKTDVTLVWFFVVVVRCLHFPSSIFICLCISRYSVPVQSSPYNAKVLPPSVNLTITYYAVGGCVMLLLLIIITINSIPLSN